MDTYQKPDGENDQVQREIEELESEASDPYVMPGTRRICARKARLLRAGYREQEAPGGDPRLINIINLASGEIVVQVSQRSLEYARVDILTVVRQAEEDRQVALGQQEVAGAQRRAALWDALKTEPPDFDDRSLELL